MMRWGINLRGDLAKLDDAEIASRCETLMADREALFLEMPRNDVLKAAYQSGLSVWMGRGPLHARVFYKLHGFLAFGGPFKYFRNRLYDLYLLDCELKDVRDEIKRRVAQKITIPVT
jgi:hypothetical protein